MKLSSSFSPWLPGVPVSKCGFYSLVLLMWISKAITCQPYCRSRLYIYPFLHYKCKITWLSVTPFLKPSHLSQYGNMGYLGSDDTGSWLCCRHPKTRAWSTIHEWTCLLPGSQAGTGHSLPGHGCRSQAALCATAAKPAPGSQASSISQTQAMPVYLRSRLLPEWIHHARTTALHTPSNRATPTAQCLFRGRSRRTSDPPSRDMLLLLWHPRDKEPGPPRASKAPRPTPASHEVRSEQRCQHLADSRHGAGIWCQMEIANSSSVWRDLDPGICFKKLSLSLSPALSVGS